MWRKLKQRISTSEFLKSVTILFSGNILANFISFFTLPIISRIYTSEAFGDYALVVSIATIVNGCASLGLASAVMMPTNVEKSKRIFTVVAICEIIINTLFLIILLLISPWYEIFSTTLSYMLSLILLYAYLISLALFSLTTIFVNKLGRNKILFWNALINAFCTLLITIPLGLFKTEGLGLICGSIGGLLIANYQMIYKTKPFIGIKFTDIYSIFREYKHFIYYQFPSNLISNFTVQYPNQIFSAHFGNSVLGSYAMAERILGIPMRLIGTPINTVYFRHATKLKHIEGELAKFTYKLVTRVLLFALFPLIFLYFFSESLFVLILGESWRIASLIISIMVLPYVLMFCTKCISYSLVVVNKQKSNLYYSFVQMILIISSIYIGIIVFDSFIKVVICFAISNIIIHSFRLIQIFYILKGYFYKFLFFMVIYLLLIIILFNIK